MLSTSWPVERPPGRYRMLALDNAWDAEWANPALLKGRCTSTLALFYELSYRGTLEQPWIGRERVRILASKGEDWRHSLQSFGQIPPALQRLHREIPNIDRVLWSGVLTTEVDAFLYLGPQDLRLKEKLRPEDARPLDRQVKPIDNDPIAVHLNV